MTKQLLNVGAYAALAAAALHAQPSRTESAFQQPGWTATPEYKFNVTHMNRPDGQTGPILGKPFSAIEVRHVMQTLADGTRVDQPETTAFYRDAQGRMRTENPDRVLIYDPVASFVYALDVRKKSYRETPISDRSASTTIAATNSGTWIATNHSDPPASGDVSTRRQHASSSVPPLKENLQPQVVNGIRAKGSRVTMTIPKGTFGNDRDVNVVNDRWLVLRGVAGPVEKLELRSQVWRDHLRTHEHCARSARSVPVSGPSGLQLARRREPLREAGTTSTPLRFEAVCDRATARRPTPLGI